MLSVSGQMEYCEKSTLRDTIDHGLHQDQIRLWRLFREILDGLAYIHQQVAIHSHFKILHVKQLELILFFKPFPFSFPVTFRV